MAGIHVYTSALGSAFLTWHNWVHQKCTPDEIGLFEAPVDADEPVSPEKHVLYLRWWADQQILTHDVLIDGVVTETFTNP